MSRIVGCARGCWWNRILSFFKSHRGTGYQNKLEFFYRQGVHNENSTKEKCIAWRLVTEHHEVVVHQPTARKVTAYTADPTRRPQTSWKEPDGLTLPPPCHKVLDTCLPPRRYGCRPIGPAKSQLFSRCANGAPEELGP